jgi:lipoprotein signal peptidase
MHILLYFIGIACVLTGITLSWMHNDLAMLSNALLSAVLFGALGKVVHLLDMINDRLQNGSKAPPDPS